MNFPVVGGRRYLFEQTLHQKPLAGSLNFPNNAASRRVWDALLDAAAGPPEALLASIEDRARQSGIRYVVIHEDAEARPDMHDTAIVALQRATEPLASDANLSVVALW